MDYRNSYKTGDLVVLKSGGPTMTVTGHAGAGDDYRCVWFAGKTLNRGNFDPAVLNDVTDEQ